MKYLIIVIVSTSTCIQGTSSTNSNDKSLPLLTRQDKFNLSNERFQEELSEIPTLPKIGKNVEKLRNTSTKALDYLTKKASRGIVLQVENYSNRFLGDARVWTRCGYESSEYPVFDLLNPGTIDLTILHNKKKLRSSCGAVSWQVMEHVTKPVRMADGMGIRFFVTWSNLDAVRGNKCKDGKLNEFMIGFQKVSLNNQGRWNEDSKKLFWETYHNEDMFSQNVFKLNHSNIFNNSQPSSSIIIESPNTELEVRGEMGSGCLTNLTVQILGKRKSKLQDSDLGLAKAKFSDEVWEQMIRQAWVDIVRAINRDKALYGVSLMPLLIDPLMNEPIAINTTLLGYEIEFLMWNISIAGLQDIQLEKLLLEREESLKNVDTVAILDIGNLSISGRYQYNAKYTGWVWGMSDMSSEGAQNFNVDMTGAKFLVELGMDVVDGCNRTQNLVITKVALPLEYITIDFNFENIGTVLGSAVSIIGELALEFSKGIIVDLVKDAVQSEISSMVCDDSDRNITEMNRYPVNTDPKNEERWHEILDNETLGWGVETLRRDILAEKFVTKVFNEGVNKHFADPNDPIVKLLDPFQMLPVDEDFRKPGLVKGHVVVCEFWLFHLSKLKLLDMKLARNEDLTFSALNLRLGLPQTRVAGKYRLNNVKVMSKIPAAKSEGTVDISLTGVTVDLRVVLRAKPAKSKAAKEANIDMELFEVEFGHDDMKLNITGMAKGLNAITNKIGNALGNKIVKMQKEVLNTEIKNILFGFADCLMYKPAMGIQTCMDKFWESLGFKVPFEFPSCQEIYNKADKKLGLIP